MRVKNTTPSKKLSMKPFSYGLGGHLATTS